MKIIRRYGITLLVFTVVLLPGATSQCSENSISEDLATIKQLSAFANIDAIEKKAEQGDSESQAILGALYAKGEVVLQNDQMAVKWLSKAANQGHAPAQFNLGLLYGRGQGLPHDDVNAYSWFNLSATQGFEEAIDARNVAYSNLSPEQRSKAQALSAELQAKIDSKKP